jgi:hypothetical protein
MKEGGSPWITFRPPLLPSTYPISCLPFRISRVMIDECGDDAFGPADKREIRENPGWIWQASRRILSGSEFWPRVSRTGIDGFVHS